MKSVELKNVYFRYKGFQNIVLKNVNMEIDYNKITLIAGLSGSGKSTLLNLITGIIPNEIDGDIKGDIFVNGNNIKGKKLKDLSKEIGIVFQNADNQIIMPHVEEEIAFGLENINMERFDIKKEIDNVCKIMQLDKDAKTKTLSGGEKQRLLSASIIAMNNKIIILDEPLANIDYKGAKILLDALNELKNKGYSIIIIEHRLDVLTPYVDDIYHVEDGYVKKIDDKNEYILKQKIMIPDTSNINVLNEPLFKIKNLNYKIKDKTIINNLNLERNKSERLLILGDNGQGKTTLTRILTRMIRKYDGEIIQYLNPKLKNKYRGKKWFSDIGIVYQNPNYQLFMSTVEKEIEYTAKNKQIAYEMLHKFNLGKYVLRHPISLSEGEKRKLTVALTLARLPKVLILDEPTVGQDYNSLKEMINIINEYRNKYNTTIITITHDIRCADALCDKCIILGENKIGGKELIKEFFNIE